MIFSMYYPYALWQPYVELWLLDFLSAVAPLKLLVHIFLETVGKFTM